MSVQDPERNRESEMEEKERRARSDRRERRERSDWTEGKRYTGPKGERERLQRTQRVYIHGQFLQAVRFLCYGFLSLPLPTVEWAVFSPLPLPTVEWGRNPARKGTEWAGTEGTERPEGTGQKGPKGTGWTKRNKSFIRAGRGDINFPSALLQQFQLFQLLLTLFFPLHHSRCSLFLSLFRPCPFGSGPHRREGRVLLALFPFMPLFLFLLFLYFCPKGAARRDGTEGRGRRTRGQREVRNWIIIIQNKIK